MFALFAAFLAVFLLPTPTLAQDDSKYTVWGSVIFSRTGERTPAILGDIPTQLTALGAQQQFGAGSFFRDRYLESFGSTNGLDSAPIVGLNANTPDVRQIYVAALDMQSTVASAQAFMQGFYPPFQLTNNDTEVQHLLDPINIAANNTYIEAPLDGYQYTQVHVTGGYDPEFVYMGANLECPGWESAVIDYFLAPDFSATQSESKEVYQTIGPVFLTEVMPDSDQWDYVNAYAIYDYLNYMNGHNVTVNSLFSDPKYIDPGTNISYLDTLRWYADQQQYAQLGNLYADNNITNIAYPEGTTGSISTISGNFLAAKMLGQLQQNIFYQGAYYKFSVLFGDYQPLMSLFALTDLPPLDSHFYGLPDFASTAVFELFSQSDGADSTTFPSEDKLWVRFYFRNGTDSDEIYQAYPLFNNGPDATDMRWTDFQDAMNKIVIGDVGTWCEQCGSIMSSTDRVFCSYFNVSNSLDFESTDEPNGHHGPVSPVVGGVIGAIVALVIAALIFGAIMLISGLRFHRVKSRKSELGGFKGSQKLASDKDLTLPKGGAIVGATVETPGSPTGGHERVGSWELKQHDLPNIDATHPARRPSYEQDDDIGDIGAHPFRDPVKPDERV